MAMNHADKQAEIVAEWRKVGPSIDRAQALQIANKVLADHSKERGEFEKWFEVNGDVAIRGVCGA